MWKTKSSRSSRVRPSRLPRGQLDPDGVLVVGHDVMQLGPEGPGRQLHGTAEEPQDLVDAAVVAAVSRWSWIDASIAASTTPPGPWKPSAFDFERRSTWMRCRPSCWRWSTRQCSPPQRRSGCGHQSSGHRLPGPKLRTRCGGWWYPRRCMAGQQDGYRSAVPACTSSSRCLSADPVSNP
jgi:hypothetical protein